MKLLHLTWSFKNFGGIESLLIDMVNKQVDTYESVQLVIINDDLNVDLINKIDKKVEICYLNRKLKTRNAFFLFKFFKILFLNRPDVVHVHSWDIIRFLLPFKFFFNFKTIYTVHADPKILGVKKIVEKFDVIVCISLYVESKFNLMFPGRKTICIHNGIDPQEFLCKNKYDKETSKVKICSIGRLEDKHKGQSVLIKSLKKLSRKKENVEVHFIGEGSSRQKLEKLASSLKIENKVKFLGKVKREELKHIYSDYDIMVLPSTNEGFGLVVLEAALSKISVIIPDTGGPKEIVENSSLGNIFECNNYLSLYSELFDVIENLRSSLLSKKRDLLFNRVINHFSLRGMLDSYDKLYKSITLEKD